MVTELALNTYVLESMCYYVGGLHDEELILSLDVEEAIIHVSCSAFMTFKFRRIVIA